MVARTQASAIAIAATLLALGWPERADADWPYSFVQITCAPKLQYASVRRMWIYNLQNKGPYLTEGFTAGATATAHVEKKHGIFTSLSLKRRPQRCELPSLPAIPGWEEGRSRISLLARGDVDERTDETSYRRIRNSVQVFAYGKLIADIGMNPYGISVGDESVEIFADGPGITIRKCSVVEPGSDLRRCSDQHLDATDVGKDR